MSTRFQGKTVGEYVMEKPALSRVFEQYGIDYCCGGKRPLEEVCRDNGMDYGQLLKALDAANLPDIAGETLNWQALTVDQMIDHILEAHHRYLYDNMPRLERMVKKVAAVHGENNPKLAELAKVYAALQTDLMMHMAKEENVLFPYARQLAAATEKPRFHCGDIGNPIRVMEAEHDTAGELLAQIRETADDFVPPAWACNTYRAMLDGLAEMEADLHRHIHEENNILFPNLLSITSALG
jgi:regulator of cell morphogenesis and NO signaling